jgi:hypothetical protein
MASALQCPACGHKHRLSALTGDPIFACEQCGRLLKTPAEYRRPEASGLADAPRPAPNGRVQRGGSATRDQTSVMRTSPASPDAATSAPKARAARRSPRPPATLAVPLQVLGWVVAVLLGGVIARYFGKFTGLLTGDSVIDILTGTGFSRYLRVFALVPFWALFTAGLMTAFVEGAKWWQARNRTPRPATRTIPPAAPKSKSKAPAAKPSPRSPASSPTASSPTASSPTAPEPRAPAAAAAPRARRIPKRDISS